MKNKWSQQNEVTKDVAWIGCMLHMHATHAKVSLSPNLQKCTFLVLGRDWTTSTHHPHMLGHAPFKALTASPHSLTPCSTSSYT